MELKQTDSDGEGNGSEPDVVAAGWYGVPTVPETYVRRPRLFELLNRSESVPLVLVSAPAGSGKTSLVADWVASRNASDRTEWVTFEKGEEAFWPGVVGGLARLGVAVPCQSFPAGTVAVDRPWLTSLAAVVAAHPSRLTLVLDGYEMASGEVANDLDFLLRHTGHRMQVVIVTRVDPVLPLYRYRLEDTLSEVRMADLAFTDAEAAELLGRAGVTLTTASVRALNMRTEGWVAGLRFSSRFLAKSEDPDRAVADVAGDRGNIAEYLMGEVLAAQTPELRDLLLSTSIPEILQPGLAEALGGPSATRMLASLSRANAFVEPVPEHPGFYRLHPFFRDLLRAELAYEAPEQMERLQRRAAQWFAQEGLLSAAVSHYAAINAWAEAAAEVVDDLAVGELLLEPDGNLATTLKAFPDGLRDPAASVLRATLALANGDIHRFATELAQVPDTAEVGGDAHAQAVSLATAVLRAVLARYSNDAGEAIALAEAAEQVLSERGQSTTVTTHPELSALVYASKGIAAVRRGQLGQADEAFRSGAGAATGLGSEALLVECLGYLALIACVRDQLSKARSLATRAISIADNVCLRPKDRPSAAQVALAWVDTERYELLAACEHVRLAELSDFNLGDPVPRTMLALVRSRLQAARGDVAGALVTVEQTLAGSMDQSGWLLGRLRLEAARLRIATDETAVAVLEVEGLAERYPTEVALVVAQAKLGEGDDDAAREALSQVLVRSTSLGVQVTGWLVEASRQLLQHGSSGKAWSALDRSLRLAAKECLRRPFREAPASVAKLLAGDVPLGVDIGWLNVTPRRSRPGAPAQGPPRSRIQASAPGDLLVVERLTDKELEVLGHLAELLTTEEIASTMFVSVNTIRTHVRSILRKLGVPRRNAAVRRARELDLLPV